MRAYLLAVLKLFHFVTLRGNTSINRIDDPEDAHPVVDVQCFLL